MNKFVVILTLLIISLIANGYFSYLFFLKKNDPITKKNSSLPFNNKPSNYSKSYSVNGNNVDDLPHPPESYVSLLDVYAGYQELEPIKDIAPQLNKITDNINCVDDKCTIFDYRIDNTGVLSGPNFRLQRGDGYFNDVYINP